MDSEIKEKNEKIFYKTFKTGLFLVLVVASFWFGYNAGQEKLKERNNPFFFLDKNLSIDAQNSEELDLSLFWKVYEELKKKYVDADKLDNKKILYGAIKGMLWSTEDPYSVFLDPEENKKLSQELSGVFEGIGAEMGIRKKILTIISPLANSPAEKAGLKPGDKIIKINNEPTSEMTLEEAVSKIRGPKDTEVILTIWRNGEQETRDIKIIRQKIILEDLSLQFKEDNKIAYLKIARFGEDTDRNFIPKAREIINKKSKVIILDMRNNAGGYLDTAINIASKMLPRGKVILIEEEAGGKKKEFKADGSVLLENLAVIVLVNEGSASASEILAAALKENAQAVLVGEKTFGKGLVQEKIDLPQGTSVKISIAKWLTPSGQQINEKGIEPDWKVEANQKDQEDVPDPQLEKALEIAKSKIEQE